MHSLFAPVDTLDTSTYLHSVVYPNNSFALQWLMPVTGLQDNGQPITPPGFDNDYGLYLRSMHPASARTVQLGA
jgi:hypothetical protein